MYAVDDQDSLVPLLGLPASSAGSPIPVVFATESDVLVAYYAAETPPDQRAAAPDDLTGEHRVGLVHFARVSSFMFGSPNDESLHGHPLGQRGLEAYGAFEVISSSWIRALERQNSVHPQHSAVRFRGLRHYILSFHDSTLECVSSEDPRDLGQIAPTPHDAVRAAMTAFGSD